MASVVLISPRDADPPLEVTSHKVRMPRYGALSVASTLAARGHDVQVFDEYVGARIDWGAVHRADYVCFSVLSFSALRAYDLADRARRAGRTVILGGCHASMVPEDALTHADYVVRNEGEAVLLDLLEALQSGREVSRVAGLSFRASGRVVHNPDRPFDADLSVPLNLDLVPEYRPWGPVAFARDVVQHGIPRFALPVVQASRGCPFGCRFCFVKHELGTRYRTRPIEVVLEEVAAYRRRFRHPYLFFVDNDLTLDSAYSQELFGRLLDRFGPGLRPFLFSRVEASRDAALLGLLQRFDRTTLGVGIESIHDDGLRELNKGQTERKVRAALARFRRYDIHLQGLFIFGSEQDDLDTIRRTVGFAVDQQLYNVGMCALYDFPGREAVLGQAQIIPDHLFIHRDWRLFSGNFVVHFPKRMRPSQLQQAMLDAYEEFYRRSPRAFYQFMPHRPTVRHYLDYLRRVEEPYYDGQRRLDQRLADRKVGSLSPRLELPPVSGVTRALEAGRFLARNLGRGVSWELLRGLVLPRGGPP
ncbi:MAG: radical SAM protein [bacterium]